MGERKPNVLLLVIDACRFDYLRGPKAETPNCDALADEGTDFRRAVSAAPWTLPSVTSLLTGEYPHEHGADSRGFEMDRGRTVTADLREAGYRCLHLSPKTWIGDWLPQGRGFHRVAEFTGPDHRHFDGGADVRRLSAGVARGPEWYATVVRRALESENPALSLANAAMYKYREATEDAWLDDVRASERAARTADEWFAEFANAEDPFFAYAHLMDPHLPFYVPGEFRSPVRPPDCATYDEELDYLDDLMDDLWAIRLGERRLSDAELDYLRRRYADEVTYADAVVGRILDGLDERGLADDTLVVLTADHGEHLGEGDDRTLLDHQTSVGFPLLRVPLVARYPGEFEGGERRDNLVQTTDVAETIRALAGLEHDPARSLLAADVEFDTGEGRGERRPEAASRSTPGWSARIRPTRWPTSASSGPGGPQSPTSGNSTGSAASCALAASIGPPTRPSPSRSTPSPTPCGSD
ncbi:sulfatase [Halorussus sp. MSC15.2]|uniref:sulfatase n=1 Tax=Halorussus sp. MSC15.2 TaxID=2283638 RepID=UPI0013D280E6|nr:sulfatase [Halorussus sp. MSC15.2]NEU56557.1 sulfatase-like hydrolase/transferase [Halorussus sp. MSC15.2]